LLLLLLAMMRIQDASVGTEQDAAVLMSPVYAGPQR
jgi:hypothetical protein